MKLVFIYGPPAAGKLTVAEELAKLTKFKVFHNHHTVDLLTEFFEFDNPEFSRLSDSFRLEIMEALAKSNVNAVFTFVYARGSDDKFIHKAIARIRKHNGNVLFVQLVPERSKIFERITKASRRNYKKIKTIKALKKIMKKYELFKKIPFVESLSIDNSNLSAKKVALQIKRHFKL